MKIKTLRRIIKIFNLLIIPLKVIFDKVTSSTTFKILRMLIKLYVFIFAVLGTGIMGLTGSDLTSVSILANDFMENYTTIFKEWFKRFTRWLSRKIYAGDTSVEVYEGDSIETPVNTKPKVKAVKKSDNEPYFSLRKLYVTDKDPQMEVTWYDSFKNVVTSPYFIIPVAAIVATGGFYYFAPDQFNTIVTGVTTSVSAYFFGNKNVNPIDSNEDDIIMKDSRKSDVRVKEEFNHNLNRSTFVDEDGKIVTQNRIEKSSRPIFGDRTIDEKGKKWYWSVYNTKYIETSEWDRMDKQGINVEGSLNQETVKVTPSEVNQLFKTRPFSPETTEWGLDNDSDGSDDTVKNNNSLMEDIPLTPTEDAWNNDITAQTNKTLNKASLHHRKWLK